MPEVYPTGIDREREIEALSGELASAVGDFNAPFAAFLRLLTSAQALAEEPWEDEPFAVRQKRADRALQRLRQAAEACR